MAEDGLTPTKLIERVVIAEERTKANTQRLDTINGQIGRAADEVKLFREDTNKAFAELREDTHDALADLRSEVVDRDEARGAQFSDLRVDVAKHATRVSMIAALASVLGTALVSATVGWFVVHSLGQAQKPSAPPHVTNTTRTSHNTPQGLSAAHIAFGK
jgi:hypothetical protein